MSAWPDFDPLGLLRALIGAGVDFVVVGAFAAIGHGATRLTQDLDIVPDYEEENLSRLGLALTALHARLRGVEGAVPFTPDGRALRRIDILTLDTDDGPLAVLRAPSGSPDWRTLRAEAAVADLGGVTVAIASLPNLIAMKRAAGRPKDLVDLAELEAIARLRHEVG